MDAPSPLHFLSCRVCTSAIHPPRPMCPACGSGDLEWKESAGVGTVYSSTAVRAREETYNVAVVDLDEGIRVMSTVAGVAPDAVPIGARVRGHVEDGRLVFDL